jgi:hypothetical protein
MWVAWIRKVRDEWGLAETTERRGEALPLWFRGHSDASWKLTPKLYRPEFLGADENEIRHEFKSRALQFIKGRVPTTELDWYFLMQHYGAPTRLLDWTENPLAALYFAVADQDGEREAAVWILDPTWLNKQLGKGIEGAMLPDWEEARRYLPGLEESFGGQTVRIRRPAAIEPAHVDPRLAAQASRFVIFGTTRDLMRTKILRFRSGSKRHLAIFRIPKDRIAEAQDELTRYGVTTTSLFPDLAGLGAELSSKVEKALTRNVVADYFNVDPMTRSSPELTSTCQALAIPLPLRRASTAAHALELPIRRHPRCPQQAPVAAPD